MSPEEEKTLKKAIVRVCGADGITRGTGFFISPEGDVLTCYHVIERLLEQSATAENNHPVYVSSLGSEPSVAIFDEQSSCLDQDIAVLRTSLPPPFFLPLAADFEIHQLVWTAGYHYEGQGVQHAFAFTTRVENTTAIWIEQREKQVLVEGVFTLATEFVNQGLSGAPLVDLNSGVTIGLITAKFTQRDAGFAVSLAGVVEKCGGSFRELFAENNRTIPRFGRYLNALGACALCDKQCDAAIKGLINTHRYLPDKYMERHEEETLEQFFQSPKKILPIVGSSGVGKTFLLANAAQSLGMDRPVMLLISSDAVFDAGGLKATLYNEIKRLGDRRVDDFSLDFLISALSGEQKELVVLLDAINDSGLLRDGVAESWISNTCAWLADRSARLIVTSRTEYWNQIEDLFWSQLLFKVSAADTDEDHLRVKDFTDEEGRTAFRSYDLEGKIPWSPLFRHPLFLRFAGQIINQSQVSNDSLTGCVNDYSLLDRYVESVCREVVRKIRATSATSYDVRQRLQELSHYVRSSGSLELPREAVDRIFTGMEAVRVALINESVLHEARKTFRFTFDQLAEFLLVDVADARKAWTDEELQEMFTEPNQYLLGALRLAFLAMEHQGEREHLFGALSGLAQKCDTFEPPQQLIEFVVHIVRSLSDPMPCSRLLIPLVRCLPDFGDGYYILYVRLAELLRDIDMPVTDLFEALRKLMIVERSRGWRQKDWENSSLDDFTHAVTLSPSIFTPAELLIESYRKRPIASAQELVKWLEDNTYLSDFSGHGTGEAKIGDVARAILFQLRKVQFGELCEILAQAPEGFRVLQLFALHDSQNLAERLVVWLSKDSREHRLAVWLALDVLSIDSTLHADDRLLAALRKIVKESTDSETIAGAVSALSFVQVSKSEVLEEILARFESDDRDVYPSRLNVYLDSHADVVIQRFDQYLKKSTNLNRREHVIATLASGKAFMRADLIIPRLASYWQQFPELRTSVANTLESHLYRLSESGSLSEIYDKALDAAMVIAREGPSSARSPIALFATLYNDDARVNPRRVTLLKELAINETDPSDLRYLIQQLVSEWEDYEACMEICLLVGQHMDCAEFEETFLEEAQGNPRFADWFGRRLASSQLTHGKCFALLKQELPRFGTAKEAIDSILGSTED